MSELWYNLQDRKTHTHLCSCALAVLLRHAACHLHTSSVKLWADTESGRYPSWEPPLFQPAWLQRDPDRAWLYHRCHQEPRDHRWDSSLPVQCGHAQCQLSTILPQPEPGGLPVGVQQLLWHVWATQRVWRIHRHWWTGESYRGNTGHWL